MKENLKATTRRMTPILAQIVQRYLPGHKIEDLAAGEKIKAREFSYSAQVYLLMLGQLAHVFSLNELVDLSTIFSGELRRIRGIEAVKLHMVANVANMLPRFAVVGKASEHDSRREEELFASLLPGDVGVLDRAYNNFPVLYRQTLQLQSFFGENQNAVEWQIWAAMLTHLVLRYIKWKNKVVSSYARFAAIIKNTIWLKRSLEAVISLYCIAPSQSRPPPDRTMPYLPGFERLAIA